jgi:hypothetical protein
MKLLPVAFAERMGDMKSSDQGHKRVDKTLDNIIAQRGPISDHAK